MQRELKLAVDQMLRSEVPFKDAVAEFKKRYLQKALESNQGDSKRAAKALGMHRDSFLSKVKKYKLKLKKRMAKPLKETSQKKSV